MDNEIKVNLTIALPGSVMLSKEECLKTTQKVIEKKTATGKVYKKYKRVQVEDLDKMNKHTQQVSNSDGSNVEVLTFYTRKSRPASQVINITKESYIYMTSVDECPSWCKKKTWKQLNSKQRLEAHLKRITESLGGTSYTYTVFDI